ncbi:MAG: ATP-binding cassette domain-containing protein, partial [Verrucomicrobiales bacterium]
LLRIMAGLLGVDEGEMRWRGEVFDFQDVRQRRELMHLPDFPLFYEELSLLKNLALHLHLYEKTGEEAEARGVDLLRRFHLLPHARKPAGSLSRGQRYKLALACWGAVRPALGLFDEPFAAGMDHQGLQEMRRLLRAETQRGLSVIYTTQFVDFALEFSDRVVLIAEEGLYFVGSAAEFRERVEAGDAVLAPFREGGEA